MSQQQRAQQSSYMFFFFFTLKKDPLIREHARGPKNEHTIATILRSHWSIPRPLSSPASSLFHFRGIGEPNKPFCFENEESIICRLSEIQTIGVYTTEIKELLHKGGGGLIKE